MLPGAPVQSQIGGNVPAFLAKLWKMVDNPETDPLISWSDGGNSFIIKNPPEFTKSMLPYYYKHSNMASFIRQLNMYGFHKVMSVDSGGLKGDKEEVEFAHSFFMRGQEHLLGEIKRKVNISGNSKAGAGVFNSQFVPNIKSEKVTEVLSEVGALRERQEDLDNKLENMKSENEALWGEVLSLRQKHNQQQKIVNKLIQFLSALLQPRGMKRSFGGRGAVASQLAIEDEASGGSGAKQQKLSEKTSRGPVIQELPAGFDATHVSEVLNNLPETSEPVQEIVIDQLPIKEKNSKYRMVDPISVNSSLVKRPTLQRELSREDFDTDIVSMQKDIDSLKDLLSGQITLDASLVSSLFNSDQDSTDTSNLFSDYGLTEVGDTEQEEAKSVTYNPSLFDLSGGSQDTALNTPMIQEEQENPLSKYFNS